MNKILLLTGATACLFAFGANAAELKPYVSAKIRYSMTDSKLKNTTIKNDDDTFGGSLAAGIFTPVQGGNIRAELEYNANTTAKDSTDNIIKSEIETYSAMANVYYDINTNSKLAPYLGAGLGVARVKGTIKAGHLSESESHNNFAWQIGAGVGYALNDKILLDAGYRYVDNGSFSTYYGDLKSSANELYLGIRYKF